MGQLGLARVAIAFVAIALAVVAPTARSGVGAAAVNVDASPNVVAPDLPAGITSAQGVGGTTLTDLAVFATAVNHERLIHSLQLIPLSNFRYDPCMEQRLFWIAEDPSPSVGSAWGHIGSQRSDAVPSVGCDGNLAGGLNNTGATVAVKWWDSLPHRAALYKPVYRGSLSGVCIFFAMTHGGVPDEPEAFARAAARWGGCPTP